MVYERFLKVRAATSATSLASYRQISTGTVLCVTTLLAWLPRRSRATPRRPWEAITIRSQPRCLGRVDDPFRRQLIVDVKRLANTPDSVRNLANLAEDLGRVCSTALLVFLDRERNRHISRQH